MREGIFQLKFQRLVSRSLSDVCKVRGWHFGSLRFLESTVWGITQKFICTTAAKCEVCHSLSVVVRYGTKKCTLRVGKYTWWLKTYIAGHVLLEKLNRTAGVIRDSVPSRCDLRWHDAYLNGSQGMQSQSVSDSPSRFFDGSPYSMGPTSVAGPGPRHILPAGPSWLWAHWSRAVMLWHSHPFKGSGSWLSFLAAN